MTTKRTRSRLVVAGGAASGLGLMVAAFIGVHEGNRLDAYRDVVGIPTICFGETRGVKIGDHKTEAQCRQLLADDLVDDYEPAMRKCLAAPDKIPDASYGAFLSLTYNIGVAAFCGSSVAKRANAGDLAGACDAMLAWNKVTKYINGHPVLIVVPGLSQRRQDERAWCRQGLAP
jgi:lysozyme